MVGEYIGLLGNGFKDLWSGQVLPLYQAFSASPFFWPGVILAALLLLLLGRLLTR